MATTRFGLLQGPVVETHPHGLVEFCCEGQSLFAEYPFIHNEQVALSIAAGAVTIDRELNAASSATNCFVCVVLAVKPEENGHFLVALGCGQTRLYARLNAIAYTQLNLQTGEQVAARFATHSFDAT
ncbi:TOBE domain-containing protein [Salinimonas marina]|nr:TOBE domain-containing protein [Salinimonas marina]